MISFLTIFIVIKKKAFKQFEKIFYFKNIRLKKAVAHLSKLWLPLNSQMLNFAHPDLYYLILSNA